MRKEKWEDLTQKKQRVCVERAASAPTAEPKSAETPQEIAKVVAKSARKKVKKTTTVTKPTSQLQRRRRRGGVTSIFGRSLVLSPQAAARVPWV